MDTQLMELPTELIEQIVAFLSVPGLIRFSRISRLCHEIAFAGDPSKFRTIDLYDGQLNDPGVNLFKFNDASLSFLLRSEGIQRALKTIRLDYCQNLTLKSFELLLDRCPNLVQISMNGCHGVEFTSKYLGSLIRRLRIRKGWEGEATGHVLPDNELPKKLEKIGLWGTLIKLPTGQIRTFELQYRSIVDQMLVARLAPFVWSSYFSDLICFPNPTESTSRPCFGPQNPLRSLFARPVPTRLSRSSIRLLIDAGCVENGDTSAFCVTGRAVQIVGDCRGLVLLVEWC
jgi:hypothetical protein